MVKEIANGFIKKKVISILLGALAPLALIIIVILLTVGSSMAIKDSFDGFFGNAVTGIRNFFISDTRESMYELLDSMSEEDIQQLPIEESILKEMLMVEAESYLNDVTIQVEQVVKSSDSKTIEKGSYSSDDYRSIISSGGTVTVDTWSSPAYDTVYITTEKSSYIDYTQELFSQAYEYRTPWQLVYALCVVGSLQSESDFISLYLPSEDETDGKLDITKEQVRGLGEQLKPTFELLNDEFLSSKKYSVEDIKNNSDMYKSVISTRTSTSGTKKTVTYYPVAKITKMKTFYMESSKSYKTEERNSSSSSVKIIDIVEDSRTSSIYHEVLVSALNYVGLEASQADILIPIISGLPGGDNLLFYLEPIVYEVKEGMTEYSFDPNIPQIVGTWTREDLIATAKSLQGLDYFFGDKYFGYGASPNWGKLKLQTIKGSGHVGEYGRTGLDCSGFVDWVYYQMLGKQMSVGNKSSGSANLWSNSFAVSPDEMLPGDLGFYQFGGGKHVGMYIGEIDGAMAFIHAGGSTWSDAQHPWGQVIVTKNFESYNGMPQSKFKYFRRLYVSFLE